MEDYLDELKLRLHILHNRDDKNLENLIQMGHRAIQSYCGSFDLMNSRGRDLVFEWVRFAYNGQTEYFYQCFVGELNMFGFSLLGAEEDDLDGILQS